MCNSIKLIHILNAEALAFDGESNEEVRTLILNLGRCACGHL